MRKFSKIRSLLVGDCTAALRRRTCPCFHINLRGCSQMLLCLIAWVPTHLPVSPTPVCTAALRRRTCPGYGTRVRGCSLMLLCLGAWDPIHLPGSPTPV